jgi:uncharacterized sporulation protein YeaH/YhbH (DUF444 family)
MPADFLKPDEWPQSRIFAAVSWYDLFSRGARDWLRHNEKIREAVKERVREFVTGPDVLSRQGGTVLVPVRLLEHARFRLRDADSDSGAGQGAGEPGQVLRPAQPQTGDEEGERRGGTGEGEVKFVLELKVDDFLDWLWEEMKLPELKPKQSTAAEDDELVREGWDKRGARSRLDRRRTIKEAVKRRAVQEHPVPFTDDDLRFRQLVRRPKPATNAAVIFALDVSGSMGETERQLAKMFFFFALQGIRRQYPKVETAFVAHTVNAWEFSEEDFSGPAAAAARRVPRPSISRMTFCTAATIRRDTTVTCSTLPTVKMHRTITRLQAKRCAGSYRNSTISAMWNCAHRTASRCRPR